MACWLRALAVLLENLGSVSAMDARQLTAICNSGDLGTYRHTHKQKGKKNHNHMIEIEGYFLYFGPSEPNLVLPLTGACPKLCHFLY